MDNKTAINTYILEQVKAGKMDKNISLAILKEVNKVDFNAQMDVAIIGMACRLPLAANAEEYWQNLIRGISAITLRPVGRTKKTKLNPTMKAGYLQEIDKFDAAFFRIPPREAVLMHPLQRLFLENIWEAIEDSGYANKELYGSRTGVFLGIDTTCPFEYKESGMFDEIFVMTGEMKSLMASRLSYIYDFKGPSFVIDSACSSGLVCIHLAIDSLKKKECNVAIAGGINLITNEFVNMGEVQSSESKLAAFDKNSSGTVWGDGVANLVLKPLAQAIKDRDNIHAIIKGTAINNDGRTSGITAPNAVTQAAVITKAWENAGIEPETVSYIEAHATGTVIGDPIEVNGLKLAFEKYTSKKQFCGIGTVKPNIGHGVGVAGISSLMKAVLSMEKGQIPPNINFRTPNPFIDFCNSPVYVNDVLTDWDTGSLPRRAGVSSFGFNRTNCHIVLEQAPARKTAAEDSGEEEPRLFTLSAKNIDSLQDYVRKYLATEQLVSSFSLLDICYTSNTGREHYNHRLVIECRSCKELFEKLKLVHSAGLVTQAEKGVYYRKHVLTNTLSGEAVEGEISLPQKQELDEKVREILNRPDKRREVCSLYLQGADPDWKELYKGTEANRVSLPTYPFRKQRYWQEGGEDSDQVVQAGKTLSHPFLKARIVDSYNLSIYLAEFSVHDYWVLTDHLIMGMHILPGTGFIEMVLGCGADYFKTDKLELYDVIIMRPLIVSADEVKKIHIILSKEKDGYLFKITGTAGNSNDGKQEWVVHVHGKIRALESEGESRWADLSGIRQEFQPFENPIDMSRKVAQFEFGPRWQNMQKYSIADNRIFADIRLNRDYIEDIGQYHLHPAMFDNAINMAIQWTLRAEGNEAFLPFSFKSIKVYSRVPRNFSVSQVVQNGLSNTNEAVVSNIDLIDEQGRVFAEIDKYSLKKINLEMIRKTLTTVNNDIFYALNWVPGSTVIMDSPYPGNVLVFGNDNPVSRELVEHLAMGTENVYEIRVSPQQEKGLHGKCYVIHDIKEELPQALEEFKGREITHVFHSFALDEGRVCRTLAELQQLKTDCLSSLFYLVRGISENKIFKKYGLTVMARCAHEVSGNEKEIQPMYGALCALTKVIGNEYTNCRVRFIDSDESTEIQTLLPEAFSPEKGFKAAYRNGVRYREELTKVDIDNIEGTDVPLHVEGCYVITGGLGGIGLEVARHLFSMNNKITVALINRSEFPARDNWPRFLEEEDSDIAKKIKTIQEWETGGGRVLCLQGDICDYGKMKQLFHKLRGEWGRINGIVHCAGIAGQGFLLNKDPAQFESVLLPKIDGTWILDEISREDNPDFFIMCSSVLALLGVPGQSDYATANAFLDAFAVYRKLRGRKALAFNWPPWEEVGMAKDLDSGMWGALKPISNRNAMHAFQQILTRPFSNIVISEFNYEKISSFEEDFNLNVSEELAEILEKKKSGKRSRGKEKGGKDQIKVLSEGDAELTAIQENVGIIFGSTLGMADVSLSDSFIDLGGDSIIAANLLKGLDALYPDLIDLPDIFTYPTVRQMAAYIEKKLLPLEAEEEETGNAEAYDTAVQQIMERLAANEISEEEADRLIGRL